MEDCKDAFKWVRKNLPDLVPGVIDVNLYGIGGDSSGGTLATLLGGILDPKPKVVVDTYGPVNFLAPHFLRPPNPSPVMGTSGYEEDVLAELLKDRNPEHAILAAPFLWESKLHTEESIQSRWRVSSTTYESGDIEKIRLQIAMTDYIGRRGPAVGVVFRLNDLSTEEERMERRKLWSPIYRAGEDYPPTAFLHGIEDMAVPIDQSREFADRLRGLGVDVLESYEKGAPHGFDQHYRVSILCLILRGSVPVHAEEVDE
jgi:acetyl esterase/lipase